jgi:hypothetical protein
LYDDVEEDHDTNVQHQHDFLRDVGNGWHEYLEVFVRRKRIISTDPELYHLYLSLVSSNNLSNLKFLFPRMSRKQNRDPTSMDGRHGYGMVQKWIKKERIQNWVYI